MEERLEIQFDGRSEQIQQLRPGLPYQEQSREHSLLSIGIASILT